MSESYLKDLKKELQTAEADFVKQSQLQMIEVDNMGKKEKRIFRGNSNESLYQNRSDVYTLNNEEYLINIDSLALGDIMGNNPSNRSGANSDTEGQDPAYPFSHDAEDLHAKDYFSYGNKGPDFDHTKMPSPEFSKKMLTKGVLKPKNVSSLTFEKGKILFGDSEGPEEPSKLKENQELKSKFSMSNKEFLKAKEQMVSGVSTHTINPKSIESVHINDSLKFFKSNKHCDSKGFVKEQIIKNINIDSYHLSQDTSRISASNEALTPVSTEVNFINVDVEEGDSECESIDVPKIVETHYVNLKEGVLSQEMRRASWSIQNETIDFIENKHLGKKSIANHEIPDLEMIKRNIKRKSLNMGGEGMEEEVYSPTIEVINFSGKKQSIEYIHEEYEQEAEITIEDVEGNLEMEDQNLGDFKVADSLEDSQEQSGAFKVLGHIDKITEIENSEISKHSQNNSMESAKQGEDTQEYRSEGRDRPEVNERKVSENVMRRKESENEKEQEQDPGREDTTGIGDEDHIKEVEKDEQNKEGKDRKVDSEGNDSGDDIEYIINEDQNQKFWNSMISRESQKKVEQNDIEQKTEKIENFDEENKILFEKKKSENQNKDEKINNEKVNETEEEVGTKTEKLINENELKNQFQSSENSDITIQNNFSSYQHSKMNSLAQNEVEVEGNKEEEEKTHTSGDSGRHTREEEEYYDNWLSGVFGAFLDEHNQELLLNQDADIGEEEQVFQQESPNKCSSEKSDSQNGDLSSPEEETKFESIISEISKKSENVESEVFEPANVESTTEKYISFSETNSKKDLEEGKVGEEVHEMDVIEQGESPSNSDVQMIYLTDSMLNQKNTAKMSDLSILERLKERESTHFKLNHDFITLAMQNSEITESEEESLRGTETETDWEMGQSLNQTQTHDTESQSTHSQDFEHFDICSERLHRSKHFSAKELDMAEIIQLKMEKGEVQRRVVGAEDLQTSQFLKKVNAPEEVQIDKLETSENLKGFEIRTNNKSQTNKGHQEYTPVDDSIAQNIDHVKKPIVTQSVEIEMPERESQGTFEMSLRNRQNRNTGETTSNIIQVPSSGDHNVPEFQNSNEFFDEKQILSMEGDSLKGLMSVSVSMERQNQMQNVTPLNPNPQSSSFKGSKKVFSKKETPSSALIWNEKFKLTQTLELDSELQMGDETDIKPKKNGDIWNGEFSEMNPGSGEHLRQETTEDFGEITEDMVDLKDSDLISENEETHVDETDLHVSDVLEPGDQNDSDSDKGETKDDVQGASCFSEDKDQNEEDPEEMKRNTGESGQNENQENDTKESGEYSKENNLNFDDSIKQINLQEEVIKTIEQDELKKEIEEEITSDLGEEFSKELQNTITANMQDAIKEQIEKESQNQISVNLMDERNMELMNMEGPKRDTIPSTHKQEEGTQTPETNLKDSRQSGETKSESEETENEGEKSRSSEHYSSIRTQEKYPKHYNKKTTIKNQDSMKQVITIQNKQPSQSGSSKDLRETIRGPNLKQHRVESEVFPLKTDSLFKIGKVDKIEKNIEIRNLSNTDQSFLKSSYMNIKSNESVLQTNLPSKNNIKTQKNSINQGEPVQETQTREPISIKYSQKSYGLSQQVHSNSKFKDMYNFPASTEKSVVTFVNAFDLTNITESIPINTHMNNIYSKDQQNSIKFEKPKIRTRTTENSRRKIHVPIVLKQASPSPTFERKVIKSDKVMKTVQYVQSNRKTPKKGEFNQSQQPRVIRYVYRSPSPMMVVSKKVPQETPRPTERQFDRRVYRKRPKKTENFIEKNKQMVRNLSQSRRRLKEEEERRSKSKSKSRRNSLLNSSTFNPGSMSSIQNLENHQKSYKDIYTERLSFYNNKIKNQKLVPFSAKNSQTSKDSKKVKKISVKKYNKTKFGQKPKTIYKSEIDRISDNIKRSLSRGAKKSSSKKSPNPYFYRKGQ